MLPTKWETLIRCPAKSIHACKKLPLALDSRIAYTILGSFTMLFPEAPAFCDKEILK